MNNHPVRVRYAPSPTGYPHVGNIRTALFNWLYARHTGGSFIVRIEDTDQARSIEGALQNILESLNWLGLDWDEGPQVGGSYGPYLQSQRLDLYHRAVRDMVDQGCAYYCYCTPEELDRMRKEQQKQGLPPRYDRRCRDPEYAKPRAEQGLPCVVRFATPLQGPPVTVHDLIRGEVTVELSVIDDFVILKSDDFPTYHLANVVDDHEMRISHVMRAEEWLPSTPRHVLLYDALGYQPPAFAHLPMILGSDRAKLSKRHGAASLLEFRDLGYLPDAMLNFLVLLGWSLDDRTELFSRDDLVRHFALERIGKSPAIFNIDKLEWMNGVYIRGMSTEELAEHLGQALQDYIEQHDPPGDIHLDRDYLMRIVPLLHERFKKLSPEEVWGLTSFFLVEDLEYAVPLTPKGLDKDGALNALRAVVQELQPIAEFDVETLEGALRSLAERLGVRTGPLFGAVRLAVTGSAAAPPLFDTLAVLGKDRVMKRLEKAVSVLEED